MKNDDPCPYCGFRGTGSRQDAMCAVCGMPVGGGHWPHILRFDPGTSPVHFCSLACMDNYEAFQEAKE